MENFSLQIKEKIDLEKTILGSLLINNFNV